jgi:protein involved in polysaccharide export with SLBB domain
VIPKIERHIFLSGSVKNPGAIPYDPSKNAGFYVRMAGGYSSRADKSNLYVLRKYNERIQFLEGQKLKAGDIIVVPEKEQFRGWNMFRDIATIVATAGGLALGIVNATK